MKLVVWILTILSWTRTNSKEVNISDARINKWKVLESVKVIIDTDGGCDDAMAILMGLATHDLDVVAITTTAGNTNLDQVVINVHKTLRILNSSIPVHAGSDKPIIYNPPMEKPYGKDGLGDVPYPYPPTTDEAQSEHAVSAMIRLVKQYPNEIVIVALGPLTNLALAIRLNPDFKKSIKSIVWTGGSMYRVGPESSGVEFNAHFDPIANFICFNETGPPIVMVPWETSMTRTEVSTDWRINVLGKINSAQIQFFNLIENRSLSSESWTARDPKTMAIVMNPNVIKKQDDYFVEPIWEGEQTRGLTLVDYSKTSGKLPNAIVVEDINVDAYKDMLKHFLKVKVM